MIALQLDPQGSWRRQRFEFCNALERVCNGDDKAWDELRKMGVSRVESSRPNHSTTNRVGESK